MEFFLKELTADFQDSVVDLFDNFPVEEFGIKHEEAQKDRVELKNLILYQQNAQKYIKKYIFFCENAPIGFATFVSNSFFSGTNCNATMVDFGIRQSYRGFGLGNLVLSKLIEKAFELKFEALLCTIQNDNEKAKKVLNNNNFKKDETYHNAKTENYFLKLKGH